ncbi:MAG: hypothetical protein QOH28_3840, partial [Actinomycetota bacterium]|nr:hypothetical protein [Actinomycetota bacterium]
MRPFVHSSHQLTCHVSVDLCRPHIGVSEQFLNRSEVSSSLEEVRGVGVAKGVRVQRPAVGERIAGENPPDVAGGHSPAAGVQEERDGPGTGLYGVRKSAAPATQVCLDGVAGRIAEREPA